MKYLKKFENTNEPKIGDYAIFSEVTDDDEYAGQYGIIVNIGNGYSKGDKVYLVEIMSNVSKSLSKIIKRYFPNSNIEPKYDIPIKKDVYYIWTCKDYIDVYKNKKDFDKEVDRIKLSKISSKYNI